MISSQTYGDSRTREPMRASDLGSAWQQSPVLSPVAVCTEELYRERGEEPVAFQAHEGRGKEMDKLKTNKEKHIVMDAANLSLSSCRN